MMALLEYGKIIADLAKFRLLWSSGINKQSTPCLFLANDKKGCCCLYCLQL
jgi:hypothetical protein